MKTMKTFTACVMGLIFLSGVFFPLAIAAEEFTCEIRASLDNYWLYIRDLDRNGNPTRDTLFRGWLMRGQTLPVTSRSGRISYTFKADSDYRDSGRNQGWCKNNQIIRIP